jgi:hypothetical protein
MRRGFTSSTGTRCGLFLLVGVLYLFLFDGMADLSAYLTFAAMAFDLLLLLAFRGMGASWVQPASFLSCSVEGVCAVLAGCVLNVGDDEDRTFLVRQFCKRRERERSEAGGRSGASDAGERSGASPKEELESRRPLNVMN